MADIERERDILNRWDKLPTPLQDRFLDQLKGAADAVETLKTMPPPNQTPERPAV